MSPALLRINLLTPRTSAACWQIAAPQRTLAGSGRARKCTSFEKKWKDVQFSVVP